MTAIASLKAYLYETSGSAKKREQRNLDYKLEGHHAIFAPRDSTGIKGKFALSVGRKIDLSNEDQTKGCDDKIGLKSNNIDPVILPKCREDTGVDLMDVKTHESSEEDSSFHLMRENTDDVPLTKELLRNDDIIQPAVICAECAQVRLTKNENLSKIPNEFTDSKLCELCEKRKKIRKNPLKQDKTLLMSIVYPHDFYDRYQNARKQFQTDSDNFEKRKDRKKSTNQQKMDIPKANVTLPDTVNEGDKIILKPHVVKFKEKDKRKNIEKTNNQQRQREQGKISDTVFPPIPQSQISPPKHLRCQPQMKAYFVASMSSKHFLKDRFSFFTEKRSFKGCMISKSDKFEKTKWHDTKHSLINVGSLGLTIGIPEYNEKLGNRPTITNNYLNRTFTALTDLNRPRSLQPLGKGKIRAPGSVGHRSM